MATSQDDGGEARGAAGLAIEELGTPALLLDLDLFERNLAKMAAHARAAGRALRPHAKTHKCPAVARAQMAAGAAGICVATLHEAQAMADADVPNLLLTSELAGVPKVRRAVELTRRLAPGALLLVLDSYQGAAALSEAASAAGVTLGVLLDLEVGNRRTGVPPGPPGVELAEQVARLPGLRLRGLQAYAGHASHTVGFEKRRQVSRAAMTQAAETRCLLERAGFDVPILSGGSTGTYNIDSEIDGVTELQAGSYVFMDLDYGRIGGRDKDVFDDFAMALTVLATVISRPYPDLALVDAGFKAFSTDRAFPPECASVRGIRYSWAGDEHGRLDLREAESDIRVGNRLQFYPPHCDPTVNLHEQIYAVRNGRVQSVWPVAARGYGRQHD